MEIQLISLIQSIHNAFFDKMFIIITGIGSSGFYVMTIPIIYWCMNRSLGMRLGLTFLGSMMLNDLIKDFVARPRPSEDVVRVLFKESAPGYSFPSGHSQGVATYWSFLSLYFKWSWFTAVAVVVMVLVGLSRLYLGVHYPSDVLAGLTFGILAAVVGMYLTRDLFEVHIDKIVFWQYLLSLIIPIVLVVISAEDSIFKLSGAFMGLLCGHGFEERFLRFEERAAIKTQVYKILLGIILLLVVQFLLKMLFGSVSWGHYLRYWVLTWLATFALPWLFIRLGWSSRVVRGRGVS